MLYVLVLDNGVVTFADIEGVIRWVAEMMKTLISPPRAFVSVGNGITITTTHGNNSLTIKASVVVDPMGSVPEESVTREYRVFRAEIPKGCRGLPS